MSSDHLSREVLNQLYGADFEEAIAKFHVVTTDVFVAGSGPIAFVSSHYFYLTPCSSPNILVQHTHAKLFRLLKADTKS